MPKKPNDPQPTKPIKRIYAIKDHHTTPQARMLAQNRLTSGDIKVFFMEWALPIKDQFDLQMNFQGLNKADAHPNLRELAALCLTTGIAVESCDLSVKDTLEVLGEWNDTHAVLPKGKAARDKHAASTIQTYMTHHPDAWDHALLMFGSDHFKYENDRGAPALHQLIELQFGDAHNDYFVQFLNK